NCKYFLLRWHRELDDFYYVECCFNLAHWRWLPLILPGKDREDGSLVNSGDVGTFEVDGTVLNSWDFLDRGILADKTSHKLNLLIECYLVEESRLVLSRVFDVLSFVAVPPATLQFLCPSLTVRLPLVLLQNLCCPLRFPSMTWSPQT
ncbi:hypothetical protein SK128_022375, partial [Halocaridina rubra]